MDNKMKHLVIGHKGEVGSALFHVIQHGRSNDDILGIDVNTKYFFSDARSPDFMHICIRYSKEFINIVQNYITNFMTSGIVIIHSSIYPLTTQELAQSYPRIVYSPVMGVHSHLIEGLYTYPKFFATTNEEIIPEIETMFESLGMNPVSLLQEPASLECAKLLSTIYSFLQLTFAQEVIMIKDKYGLSLETIRDFIGATPRKLVPYIEKVDSHCLIFNAEILSDSFPLAKFMISRDAEFGKIYGNQKIKIYDDV